MASPKSILTIAIGTSKQKEDEVESCMSELVEKAFTTRNLLHYAHLSTKSYAAHKALGEMYEEIIDKVDSIAEVYQGKFGLLDGLEQCEAKIPTDITKYVEDEAKWIDDNRVFISKGYKPIDNMIDDLLALYQQTLYKLKNLS
jgi:phage-related minor tail protein